MLVRRTILTSCAVLGLWGASPALAQEAVTTPVPANAVVQKSAVELEALVAPIALYEDSVIENLLAAAQDPVAIEVFITNGPAAFPNGEAPPELMALAKTPDVLKEMHAHAAWTAHIAEAARTQLVELWEAIDRIRASVEAQQAAQAPAEGATVYSAASPVYVSPAVIRTPYAGFVAGALWTHALYYWEDQYCPAPYPPHATPYPTTPHPTTTTTVYVGPNGGTTTVQSTGNSVTATSADGQTTAKAGVNTTTVTGPNGNSATANSAGVAGVTTEGNTTKYGAAGATNVTTSNGGNYSAAGSVKGSVTTTENGTAYQQDVQGGVVNNNTGEYVAGTRSTSGQTMQNADGSESFNRSASTSLESSRGATDVEHTSSGTITGDGNGTYNGSTTIDSTRGDATINTQASDGTVTTTVTTDKGTKEYTNADGTSQRSTASASEASRTTESAASSQTSRRTSEEAAQAFGLGSTSDSASSSSRFNRGQASEGSQTGRLNGQQSSTSRFSRSAATSADSRMQSGESPFSRSRSGASGFTRPGTSSSPSSLRQNRGNFGGNRYQSPSATPSTRTTPTTRSAPTRTTPQRSFNGGGGFRGRAGGRR